MPLRLELLLDVDSGPETIRALASNLEALTRINETQVGALPPLYAAGVRYRSECSTKNGRRSCTERWCDARTAYAQRHLDCEDASTWRAAELRLSGIHARAVPFYARPGLVHCVTWTGDGYEDPSEVLGMPSIGRDYTRRILDALAIIGDDPWT